MKTRTFAIIATIAAVVAALCTSCGKFENKPKMDSELIGTWEGSIYTTFIDGKPVGDPVIVTFTFSSTNFTWKRDGATVVSSSYSCDTSAQDGKYFQWSQGDTSGGDTIFYSISGNTMTIKGANGSILLSIPKTLTRK
ncbi:MAG: hypothetical protein MJY89_07990 [Bacteroidales bacterium]|nr:hypothetical protein [Bacteroidales bacterium]